MYSYNQTDIFIGVARKGEGVSYSKTFEAMKDEFRDIPRPTITELLDTEILDSAENLEMIARRHVSGKSPKVDGIIRFAMLSKAKDIQMPLSTAQNPLSMRPRWSKMARNQLMHYVEIDPYGRSEMMELPFFDDDPTRLSILDRYMTIYAEPAGAYDPEAFVAGVALDRIGVRPAQEIFA